MSFAGFTRVACWVLNLNKNTGPTGIYWTTESALRQLCPGTSASPRGKCTTLRGKKISRSHWCPACWTASDTKALPYTILWACAEATHVKHNVMHTLFCTANITWEKNLGWPKWIGIYRNVGCLHPISSLQSSGQPRLVVAWKASVTMNKLWNQSNKQILRGKSEQKCSPWGPCTWRINRLTTSYIILPSLLSSPTTFQNWIAVGRT